MFADTTKTNSNQNTINDKKIKKFKVWNFFWKFFITLRNTSYYSFLSIITLLINLWIFSWIISFFSFLNPYNDLSNKILDSNQEFPLSINDPNDSGIKKTEDWIENIVDERTKRELEVILYYERLVNWFSKGIDNDKKKHSYFKSLNKNIILYGPPGSGKTHIADWLCKHESFGYISISGNLDEIFLGSGSKKWRSITNNASACVKKYFRNFCDITSNAKPFIILINEIDGIGRKKKDNSPDTSLVNEILNYIDKKNKNIVLIGTTNDIGLMEQSFVRQGRFSLIHVGYPNNIDGIKKLVKVAIDTFFEEIKLSLNYFDEDQESLKKSENGIFIPNDFIEIFSKLLEEKYLKKGFEDKLIIPYIKSDIIEKIFYVKLEELKELETKKKSQFNWENKKIIFDKETLECVINNNLENILKEKKNDQNMSQFCFL